MRIAEAAERWARTWEQAWPARELQRIAELYAPDAPYRSHPHRELTLSGTTVLRFDDDGRVVDHVDYWVESAGRRLPFACWGAPRP